MLETASSSLSVQSEDKCAHCGAPILFLNSSIQSDGKLFCCSGCQSVYESLSSCGLGDFYNLKNENPHKPVATKKDYSFLDQKEILNEFTLDNEKDQMYFYVEGIKCAACVWALEKIPELTQNILSVRVDAVKKLALVKIVSEGHFSDFAHYAQNFGYQVRPIKLNESLEYLRDEEKRSELKRIAITAVCAGNIMLLSFSSYLGLEGWLENFFNWVSLALMVPVVTIGAAPIFSAALSSIKSRTPSLDLPLAVALSAGFILSFYHVVNHGKHIFFDSLSALVFLILVSRYFVNRLQDEFLRNQVDQSALFPLVSNVKTVANTFIKKLSKKIIKTDQVKIAMDQVIPCDGLVISGQALIEDSILSGEYYPKKIITGSKVYAGSRVLSGEIIIEATETLSESRMSVVLRESQASTSLKSQTNLDLENWSIKFTWTVLFLALLTFGYFLSVDVFEGFNRALALLIVACPCAIAFGAPLIYAKAISNASKIGIYIRSTDVFERIHEVKNLFFDKTGTLTYGRLILIQQPQNLTPKDKAAILAIESGCIHPIAQAIVKQLSSSIIELEVVTEFKNNYGLGVEGVVDGFRYEIKTSEKVKTSTDEQYFIAVDIFRDGEYLDSLIFQDKIREEVSEIIQKFKKENIGLHILSGDKKENVQKVAKILKMDLNRSFGELSPEEKKKQISQYPRSAMIGDGVNDASAMAVSHLSVVVSGAMEKALKVTDIFMLKDGLKNFLKLWDLSKIVDKNLKKIKYFSIAYNIMTSTLAIMGFVTPLIAAILMPVSSVIVLMISTTGFRGFQWK